MAEKIAAVATGHARTGIGILRLSGDGCIEAAGQVFHLQSGKPLSSLPDRKLALGTLFDVSHDPRLNHAFEVTSSVLADEAADQLRAFFRARRKSKG